jgi:hypothetical protein
MDHADEPVGMLLMMCTLDRGPPHGVHVPAAPRGERGCDEDPERALTAHRPQCERVDVLDEDAIAEIAGCAHVALSATM